jgi:hypothetical protein
VVSFLAARAAPTGGFWIALAGGVALARVAERRGARQGFGASLAAVLETVAIIGPARFGVPFTQAVSAPMLGRLTARSVGAPVQMLACGAVRLLHNTATTAFFIWVVAGGLDAYAGTYDAIAGRIGIEVGTADALVLTAVGLLAWAAFASVVQVLVYLRGLRGWEADAVDATERALEPVAGGSQAGAGAGPEAGRSQAGAGAGPEAGAGPGGPSAELAAPSLGRFDPRAIALAAAVAFGLLLAGTSWALLAIASAWLAGAWVLSRPDRGPLVTGLVFAGVLAAGAFVFALGGGLGLDMALRRALRAGLLVMVATWLRAAARAEGLREVSRRALGRLRRVPSVPEAVEVLDQLSSEGRLVRAGRSLTAALRAVRRRPLPVLDAVLGWVVREAATFRAEPPGPPPRLAIHAADIALVALAAAPALALAAG